MFNKLLLTVVSVLALVILINTNAIDAWLQQLVLPNWGKVKALMHEDIHDRKVARWGSSYLASFHIKKYFEKHDYENPVILFEPNEYYKKNNIKFKAPEPITFYYFTGLQGLWMDSERLKEATHYVTVTNKKILIYEIRSPEALDSLTALYNSYKPTL